MYEHVQRVTFLFNTYFILLPRLYGVNRVRRKLECIFYSSQLKINNPLDISGLVYKRHPFCDRKRASIIYISV